MARIQVITPHTGSASEWSSATGVSASTSVVRTGAYSFSYSTGCNATGNAFLDTSSGSVFVSLWVYPTGSFHGGYLYIINSSGTTQATMTIQSNGTISISPAGGGIATTSTSLSFNTWAQIKVRFTKGTGSNATAEVTLGASTVTSTGGSSSVNPDHIGWQTVGSGTGYLSDIIVDNVEFASAGSKVICRQFVSTTPAYNAWTKSNGSTIDTVWNNTPSSSANYAVANSSGGVQTARVSAFSSTQSGKGSEVIGSSDTIGLVKAAIVGKRATGAARTHQVRVRFSSTDFDSVDWTGIGTSDAFTEFYPTCILASQTTGAGSTQSVYSTNPAAQTFTAAFGGHITRVSVNQNLPSNIVVQLRSGSPTGTVLATGTWDSVGVKSAFFSPPVTVTAGSTYAITFSVPSGSFNIYYNGASDAYSGGGMYVSTDSGSSYSPQNYDIWFNVYAIPSPAGLDTMEVGGVQGTGTLAQEFTIEDAWAIAEYTPSPNASVTLTGVQGSYGVTAPTIQGGAKASPSGAQASPGVTSPSITAAASVTLSQVSGSGTGVGTPSIQAGAVVSSPGVQASPGVGTVSVTTGGGSVDQNVPVAGVQGSSGVTAPAITAGSVLTLTGIQGSPGVGTVSQATTVNQTLTGIQGSAGSGVVSVSAGATITVSGVLASAGVSSLTIRAGGNASLTGTQGAVGAGTVAIQAGSTSTLTGVQANPGVTSPSITGTSSVTLSGVQGDASAGTVTGRAGASVTLTGVQATPGVTSPNVTGTAIISISGTASSSGVGSVTGQAGATSLISGIQGSATPGTLALSISSNIPVSGVPASPGVTSPSVITGLIAYVTGVQASPNLGTLEYLVTVNQTLTGVQGSAGIAAPSISAGSTSQVTGVQGAPGSGTVTVSAGSTNQISGVQGIAGVSGPAVSGSSTASISGVQGSYGSGTATVLAGSNSNLSGVQGSPNLGSPGFQISSTCQISGVQASSGVGSVSATTTGEVLANITGVPASPGLGALGFSVTSNVSLGPGVQASPGVSTPATSLSTYPGISGVQGLHGVSSPLVSGGSITALSGITGTPGSGDVTVNTTISGGVNADVSGVYASPGVGDLAVSGTALVWLDPVYAYPGVGVAGFSGLVSTGIQGIQGLAGVTAPQVPGSQPIGFTVFLRGTLTSYPEVRSATPLPIQSLSSTLEYRVAIPEPDIPSPN